jgi:signal transduction histidine kinase
MSSFLSGYYYTRGEVVALLVVVGVVGAAALWALWRIGRSRQAALEQALSEVRTRYDKEYFRALHDHLQSAIAHEVVKGLDYISNRSQETVQVHGQDGPALRDKQHRITAKAAEMAQHAVNITHLFAPEPVAARGELLNITGLVESVLRELYPYAQSKGVTLRPALEALEPVILDRDSALLALRNVIHNAIRYSEPGRVVEVALSVDRVEEEPERRVCVDVKDRGCGIQEADQGIVFDLRRRGDGLIEAGSGLGLYLAREAARRQGGDLILVDSNLNRGSTFRIIFPYTTPDLGE